jgi:hypothetical protein
VLTPLDLDARLDGATVGSSHVESTIELDGPHIMGTGVSASLSGFAGHTERPSRYTRLARKAHLSRAPESPGSLTAQLPTDVPHVGTVLPPGAIGARGMFTCHDGWHVVAHAGHGSYVRVAVRLRDEQGTYVYRVGPVPDDEACRTIWCYGDKGVPWTCTECGEPISAPVYNHTGRRARTDRRRRCRSIPVRGDGRGDGGQGRSVGELIAHAVAP